MASLRILGEDSNAGVPDRRVGVDAGLAEPLREGLEAIRTSDDVRVIVDVADTSPATAIGGAGVLALEAKGVVTLEVAAERRGLGGGGA